MALPETAKLVTQLSLDDKLTGPLAKAEAGVAKVGATSAGAAAKGMSNLEKKTTAVGNAFSHASGQAKGFFSGITGFVGAGALLGVGIFLNKAVQEAAEFGANVSKVHAVTGLANESASAMVDTLNKWGVASDRIIPLLGRMEKNVGTLAQKSDGLLDFQTKYGVSLTDQKGKILDANALLLKSADYFNSNATATQKATFMSTLWGKAWQDLIPILSKGSDFIRAQEADAIHLTDTQIANIDKFRNAQRDFADAFGDVQVKIGTELMPLITGALKDVSAWLDSHGDEIAQFFHDAADFAGQAASAVGMVFGALKAGWDAVPKPLRDLLVTGLVADKTIKFLFGFDPAAALFKGATGLFSRGGSPLSPLFVTQVGGLPGLPGGTAVAAGEGAAATGLKGALTALVGSAAFTAVVTAGLGVATVLAINEIEKDPDLAVNSGSPRGMYGRFGAVGHPVSGATPAVYGVPGATRDMDKAVWAPVVTSTRALTAAMRNPKWLQGLEASWRKMGEVTHAQVELARKDLESGTNIAKAAEFLGHARGAGAGGEVGIRNDIRMLNAALKKTYDPTETRAIANAIHRLRDRLPTASENHRILQKAEKIATSTEGTKAKIADLKGLLKDVDSKGLRGKLQDIISKVPRSTDNTTRKVSDAGRKIDSTKTAVQSGARTNAAATRSSANTVTNTLDSVGARIVAALYATATTVNVTASDVQQSSVHKSRTGPSSSSHGGVAGHAAGRP